MDYKIYGRVIIYHSTPTCDACLTTTHATCAGLSRLEAECLCSKRGKIKYYCDSCNIIVLVASLPTGIETLKKEVT